MSISNCHTKICAYVMLKLSNTWSTEGKPGWHILHFVGLKWGGGGGGGGGSKVSNRQGGGGGGEKLGILRITKQPKKLYI